MIKNIKVAFVEPRYQINLGYEARVLKNFEIRKMYLVNPKCKFNGKNAIKYSKHAHDLIENAAILKDLNGVTRNSFVVGTTALWRKSRKYFDNVMTLPEFEEYIRGKSIENMTLLIGRDNTGLNSEELFQCNSIHTHKSKISNVEHIPCACNTAVRAHSTEAFIVAAGNWRALCRQLGFAHDKIAFWSKRRLKPIHTKKGDSQKGI